MRALLAFVLIGCGSQAASPPPMEETSVDASSVDAAEDAAETFAAIDPPVIDKPCTEDTTAFLNPERGLMEGGGIALTDSASYASFRGDGYSLAYAKVRLDAFRDKPLDASLLDALDKGFGRVREAGIKVVLRFVYNDPTTYPSTDPDASQTRILGHLGQLAPVLAKNVDVIAVMEAGFIGLWGEWHHSSNGLETKAARTAITDAILAALPPSRRVLVRAPRYKIERFPTPVEAKDVFGTSAIARIGHHNDCFLASGDDQGTYDSDADRTYLEADSTFLPVGGESCEPNPPRTECPNALAELGRFHWSFYNPLWHPDVWTAWAPCRDEITRKLGYRFVIDRVQYPPAVRPGGVIPIEIDWHNVGFASMWNDRPAKIVLDDGTKRWVAELTSYDVFHRVQGGSGGILVARLRVPASAKAGKAKIELWLPDASASIADRPEYSVRIASKEVAWDATHGTNVLAETSIDPAAPGTVDATATTFSLLP
ncbi:MAG: DUF4832 domain-containing protein [Polyangiales bacterium]